MSAPNDSNPMTDPPLCTGDPLARALSQLEPMPTAMSRDQLMFAAGAAGRDRDVAFWKRIVYGQATAVCLMIGVGVSSYPESTPGSRPADGGMAVAPPGLKPAVPSAEAIPLPAPSVPREVVADAAKLAKYLQLRADVLAGGIGVLPNPNAPPANVDIGKLEDSLQVPRGTFAIHGLPAKPKPPADDE